ncbi:unnamed protein product [Knipowitschia caucasica]
MLSERHDVNAISHWLTEWIHAGAPVPKEVVCDFSLAILGALVRSFTPHPDFKTYLNECFNIMTGNPAAKLPHCYIRVDVAHCIKLICQWESLRKKAHRVKDFFVILLPLQEILQSLEHARDLLRAIMVVALSEGEGHDKGLPVTSEGFKTYLKAQISEETNEIPHEESSPHPDLEHPSDLDTDLKQWVEDIYEESQSFATSKGDRDDIHFLPDIIPHIKRLASSLPLWSAVLTPTSLVQASQPVLPQLKWSSKYKTWAFQA